MNHPPRQRCDVRGNPIERTRLFPVVRASIVCALAFAGVTTAVGHVVADAAPIANPEPAQSVALVSAVCRGAR